MNKENIVIGILSILLIISGIYLSVIKSGYQNELEVANGQTRRAIDMASEGIYQRDACVDMLNFYKELKTN